ncbi:abortive phage infection protein [Nonlabens sp. YIK11]|uniref:CPBP family intramembrane glutamic endopeptidase n=1 Tax=Nonlabens sp. YIK11 TaxID=1453349 RepID=UPI0006DC0027|nr:CPBP family intramembrane glutamic endopeptidase [Nonlabens sp. YIK11]KQC33218.1 abortive phage infection protein [Nonlabens sp. YIK11]
MFIKRAANKFNEPWRWILGFIVIFAACQVIGATPFAIAIAVKTVMDGNMGALNDASAIMGVLPSNLTFFLLMISFVFGILGWWIWVKYVHKLSWTQATTSRVKFDWSRAWFAFIVVGLVSIISTVAGYYLIPEDYIWNFDPVNFGILFVLAIVLVPIQTTWEELFFRSYMMQGLGLMAKNRAVPFIVTSLIFGLMHLGNPEIAKLGYTIMFWYVGTGFLLGLFTLMDEGTELAIGFHAANNLFIALLVTADWTAFQTESLLIDVSDPEVNFTTFIPLLVYYPALVLLFAWKYKWTNWKERLFGKVEVPAHTNDDSIEFDNTLNP